jgi:hypothetical protein
MISLDHATLGMLQKLLVFGVHEIPARIGGGNG